jgi:mycothiol synthase
MSEDNGGKDMLTYRHYAPGDESKIVEIWNECLEKDPMSMARFRQFVLLDPNFDPLLMRLAFDGEDLVGCVYFVRRLVPMIGLGLQPEDAWVPFFFVKPSHRRQGVGARLFREGLAILEDEGRKNVHFAGYVPNYILPGIDEDAYPEGFAFLKAIGFEVQYTSVAMDVNLVHFSIPEDVKALKSQRIAEGYAFEKLTDATLYSTLQFAMEKFNPDWARVLREGISMGLPLSQVIIARKGDRVVGFVTYGAVGGVKERFGPFGVDGDERGKGLGKILLYEGLFDMHKEGLQNTWFLWTDEKSPAGHLYKRAGFYVSRSFHIMKKAI